MSLHPLRRDAMRERRRYRSRVIVGAGLAGAGLLVLFLRAGHLQIVEHEHYTTLSRENRIRVHTIAPARGLVRDRNGVVLARNFSVFSLEIVPEQTGGVDRTLALLHEILTIDEGEEEKFRRQVRQLPGFESIPLKTRLDEREVAVFSVNRHRLPGVDIHTRLVREYPFGEALAHVVGYVGRINADERSRLEGNPHYRATRHIGKTGVEHSWERTLHGYAGLEQVEVDARGRVVRTIDSTDPVPGAEVTLGLDVGLQLRAHAALSGQVGAIVAVDPRDGAVLALVSVPSFDPNPLVHGIDRESYAKLVGARHRPMFNRALHGQYSPGSVAKIFLAFAGLDQSLDLVLGRVWCGGSYRLPGTTYEYRDWKAGGHGRVGLERGLAESCDVYFYELAYKLGITRIHRYLTRFGLGQPTGVDLPREAPGLVPSREWKLATLGRPWMAGETIISGIGQGYVLSTPLQLASATATVAGRGVRLRPRAAIRIERNGVAEDLPVEDLPPVVASGEGYWTRVIEGMEGVVHAGAGTARRIGEGLTYRIAGKTGTAQVVHQETRTSPDDLESIPWERRDHALFAAFAPVDDPTIAVAVVVEHGGSGSRAAAPIARELIDHHLHGASGEPAPLIAAGAR